MRGAPFSLSFHPPPAPGGPESLSMDAAGSTTAEEVQPLKRKGAWEHGRRLQKQEEEELVGTQRTLFPGGRSRQQEPEEEEEDEEEEEKGQHAKQWAGAKRWSKMDRLAEELEAEKRREQADEEPEPDRSMKLPFRGPARAWRPASREDSLEAGLPLRARSFPEEKEEGSANRRAEVGLGGGVRGGKEPGSQGAPPNQ